MRASVRLVFGLFFVACAGASQDRAPASARPGGAPGAIGARTTEARGSSAEVTSAPTVLAPEQLARDAALMPKARALLAAFSNGGALLTRSGAVVFTSNRDGLPQLYVGDVAHPKAPPRRLATPHERVAAMTLTADERFVLFTSDVGADGNFHVFRVGVDGTGLIDLTPGAEKLHRDGPSVALAKAGLFAFSAHAPSSEKTRVFLQTVDGAPPREVYADERGGSLHDLSRDGARALFGRSNSDYDTVIFEVATANGHASRIYPPDGEHATANAAYSAAGDRIFVATQREGRPAEIIAIDAKTRKTAARYDETILPDGGIDGIAVSPAGDRIAIAVDGGNHREIRLLDARSLQLVRTLDLGLGGVGLGAFTADGKRLTITHAPPDVPGDIFAADATTGAVTPLRDEERPGLSSMAPIKVSIEKIPAFDGLVLPTNLYLPAKTSEKLPTLVSIHGGPTNSAYVQWSPTVRFFASLGYAIVEPNIRGSTGFGIAFQRADDKEKRANALRDVETINRWARAQPWCDPGRLVIMGQSYGGYMTLLALGRQPQLWRAGLDVSGMSDLRTMERLEDQALRVFDESEFGILGKEDDLLLEWSPLKFVNAMVAPVFVYQGVGDPITPQNEADQMVRALRQRSVPVEYMLLANEGHGIVRTENKAEYLARAARFLETHAGAR